MGINLNIDISQWHHRHNWKSPFFTAVDAQLRLLLLLLLPNAQMAQQWQ